MDKLILAELKRHTELLEAIVMALDAALSDGDDEQEQQQSLSYLDETDGTD